MARIISSPQRDMAPGRRQRITQLLAKEEAKLAALSKPPRADKEKEIC